MDIWGESGKWQNKITTNTKIGIHPVVPHNIKTIKCTKTITG
jgi:hypothetical protein